MDLEQYVAKDFNGCLSVRQDGQPVIRKAYGFSDLANHISNTPSTRFAAASAGKVFVACAILHLVEAGRLGLHDPIASRLPFDLLKIDPDITVEQLLTHTSGMPDYFDESVMEDYSELWRDFPNYRIRTSADLLPLFIHKSMLFPKGERFQYNNAGFVVLGLLIEAVTGLAFDHYVSTHIFRPCSMLSTGYFELDRLPSGCANSYLFDVKSREYYTNIYSVDAKGTGAGGVFTTVEDMDRFWDALLSFRLLTPRMTKAMLSSQVPVDETTCYGYGIWLKKETGGHLSPYVQGSDPGVSFVSARQETPDAIITIASNLGQDVWRMLRDIRKELGPPAVGQPLGRPDDSR